ncbi:unnamed protein product [Mytilus coruscus]|uniref:Novel STAND NTPase 3 domain-containing protein n=1 Tax=Mytilus coruscus TaxID=42192 RepID=A0A6J8DKL5_MYTCO|nr:unnamed protein product [Mytilus coruscus]
MLEYMQFLLVVTFAGFANSHYSCLTWEFKGNNLSLICRIQQEVQSVSFIDSNGILQAKCTFKNSSNCASIHMNGSIIVNSDKNEVIFIIKEYKSKRYINEEWTCSQGNHILKAVVSTSKGIIDDTDLILSGTVSSNLQSMNLTCFSCREPHGNIVEFLKNDRSEDVVRYNSVTKKCTHINGECRPETCSCTPSGNEFTRNFPIVDINKYTTFSCSMKFVDLDKSSRFLKYSTIVLKEKVIIVNGSQTIITKPADNRHELNDEKRNVSDARNNMTVTSTDTVKAGDVLKWFGISVAFAMPFVVAVVVIFCCRLFKKGIDEKETASPLITKPELPEFTETILETWIERDTNYYETNSFEKVKDAFKNKFCVSIIGAAGEGKTLLAKHAALQYGKQGYTILPIGDPEELIKSIKFDERQFIFLDDPLGKHYLDEQSLQSWIQQSKKLRFSLMNSQIKIVVTMRNSIFRYYQTRINDTIFSSNVIDLSSESNVIDLSSESNRLSIEEKQGILEENIKYLTGNIDSNIKQLIVNESYYPGFPLMCYKLCADSSLPKNINLDPYRMVVEHISEFSSSEPFRYHYCCLVLAFMHNCDFDINDFTLCKNANFVGNDVTGKEKIENIIKSCHISSRDDNCFSNLKNGFEALSGSFFENTNLQFTQFYMKV